jgi:DNA-directed RNA polymerase specialized sigma24 family protein
MMASSALFPDTRWTLIDRIKTSKDENELRLIVDELCTMYYEPIFKCFLNRGCSKEDAQDLTQTLFMKVVRKDLFAAAEQTQGRVRDLLGTLTYRCWADWLRSKTADKRGNGIVLAGEGALEGVPSNEEDFRMSLDRNWAIHLMNSALSTLRRDYANKAVLFDECCRVVLELDEAKGNIGDIGSTGEKKAEECYNAVAERLGMTESAFRQAVYRFRKNLAAGFRDEVTRTLPSPNDVTDETKHLLMRLGGDQG